jgi:hypothetical protein
MENENIQQKPNRTIIYLSIAGALIGLILLLTSNKKEAPKVIKKIKPKIKTKTKVIVVDTKGTEIHNEENEEEIEEEVEETNFEVEEENGK